MSDDPLLDYIESLGGEPLRLSDAPELQGQRAAVLELMRDGRWHDAETVRTVAGGSEGLRRLRELREWYDVHKRRVSGSRLFEYALTEKGSAPP